MVEVTLKALKAGLYTAAFLIAFILGLAALLQLLIP
jgi:hypothetical protein